MQSRPIYSVCVSMVEESNEDLRITFDDIKLTSQSPVCWKQFSFFTDLQVERVRVLSHQLTEKEYAAIGGALMARLVALMSLEKP